jgi:O-antigen ligase
MLATLLVFTLSLFAKSPLMALGVITVGFVWQQRRRLSTYKVPAAILAGVGVAATLFIPFIRQRAAEMLGLFHQTPSDNLIQNSVHMRRLIWNTDVTLLRHYWLAGMGPGRVLQALHQHYFFHSLYRGYPVGYYDPHSQYFAFWLAFGVLGILVFIIMLLMQVRNAIIHRHTLYGCLLVVLIITFFTETMLARQQGVLFYSIFTALLFFTGNKPRPSNLR